MQTATNPQTGETAVLVGDKWQKAERIASNEKGEKAYLVGGAWITDSGKADLPNPSGGPVTASGVGAEIGKGLLRGGASMGQLVNQAVPGMVLGPVLGPIVSKLTSSIVEPALNRLQAKPQNEVERFAGTGAEIAGAGIASGGVGTVRNAVMTGLSALGGATGEQVGGETGKLVGAIAPSLLDMAFTLARNVPKNMVARNTQAKTETQFAQRGDEISNQTGIDLSLGQRTGDEAILTVEGMAAKNPFSARKFQEFGGKQVTQAVSRLTKIMDDISPQQMNDIRAGQIVNQAFDDAVKSSVTLRSKQAAQDFGAVNAAAKNSPVVQTNNVRKMIDDLVAEFDVPGGGDATASLVTRLKALGRSLSSDAKQGLTANETNRLLQVYTNASSGKGQLFKDLDTAQQRLIAGRLKTALLNDLDEAADAAQGGAAALLKTARDNYKANSLSINKLEESVLGKYLGQDRSPERVADFLLKSKPTELQNILSIVNKTNPEAIPQVRRYFVEKAIENAVIATSKRNPGSPNFSASKFIDSMPEGTKFEVVFGSSNARNELKMVGEALERIAYRGFTEGSPTAPLLMAWDATKKLFTIQGLAGLPAAAIAPQTIAKASLTPEGRRAIVTLGRYDKPTEATIRAAGYLAALASKEQQTPEQTTARTEETAATP
jgi:hypothetical protein